MKGIILDFGKDKGLGVISGDDGIRYNFDASEWKSSTEPKEGCKVDFTANTDDKVAMSIYAQGFASAGGSKKIAAALLALFLGTFGAHKFYLGYKKQGITMLLVFVLGFILLGLPSMVIGVIAFVEFILYLIKSDEEFEQTYVIGKKPWF